MAITGSNHVGDGIRVRPATLFDETFPIAHVVDEFLTESLGKKVFNGKWGALGVIIGIAQMTRPI